MDRILSSLPSDMLGDADMIWKMLDTLSQEEPEKYSEFIRNQIKEKEKEQIKEKEKEKEKKFDVQITEKSEKEVDKNVWMGNGKKEQTKGKVEIKLPSRLGTSEIRPQSFTTAMKLGFELDEKEHYSTLEANRFFTPVFGFFV